MPKGRTIEYHGLRHLSEYSSWANMHSRCKNKDKHNYYLYGGRGISVCPEWRLFKNFFSDMGYKPSRTHTLDRIDSDGNYCKSNCRWATRKEQIKNKHPKGTFTNKKE